MRGERAEPVDAGLLKRAAVAILVVALLVRVALVVGAPDYAPSGDAADFDRHAVSIARHGQYPESLLVPSGGPAAFRPPAYPHLLAAAYTLSGSVGSTRRYRVGRLLGALLGTLTVALIGLFARLVASDRVALVAMAVAAIYPPLVTVGDAGLSEALFTPLVIAGTIAVLRARGSPHALRWAIAAGVLGGLAALTRTNGAVVLVALLVGLWAVGPRGERGGPVAAGALAALFAVAPWLVRDAIVMNRFVPVTTQSGYTLAGTYNDQARNDPDQPAAWRVVRVPPYTDVLARRDLNEAQMSSKLDGLVRAYIGDHPTYLLKVGYWNTLRMFSLLGLDTDPRAANELGVSQSFSDVDVFAIWLVLPLAIAGAFTKAARRIPKFVWLIPVLLALSQIFVIAGTRYREPIDPFLLLLASCACVGFLERRRSSVAGAASVA